MTNQFFEQFQCNNVIDKFSFFLVCILRGEGEGKALLSQLFFWGIFLIGYWVSTPNDHGRMLFHGNFFFFWTRSKLGDYKCRKVTEPDFWKKFLIWRYLLKSLKISPKSDTLIFFSKMALTTFLVFGLKLVLYMTFNLNETYFSEKFAILRYLASKSSKKMPKSRFLAIFSTLHN